MFTFCNIFQLMIGKQAHVKLLRLIKIYVQNNPKIYFTFKILYL